MQACRPEVLLLMEPGLPSPPRWREDLLARAAALAQALEAELSLVYLAPEGEAPDLIDLGREGVARVLTGWNPSLETDGAGAWQGIISQIWRERCPLITLAAATAWGRRVTACLAAGHRAWLVPHCTSLEPLGLQSLEVSRLVLGGQMETLRRLPLDRPLLAAWEPAHLVGLAPLGPARPPVERLSLRAAPAWPETVLERRPLGRDEEPLPEAEIVVAVGGGAGDREGFALVTELARVLDGAMAGSQVAAERGWISPAQQIGRSGLSVAPALFVACGISGSLHFTAGMQNAGLVLAINRDPEAPIFRLADYGMVGDLRRVLPVLIRQIRQRRGRAD